MNMFTKAAATEQNMCIFEPVWPRSLSWLTEFSIPLEEKAWAEPGCTQLNGGHLQLTNSLTDQFHFLLKSLQHNTDRISAPESLFAMEGHFRDPWCTYTHKASLLSHVLPNLFIYPSLSLFPPSPPHQGKTVNIPSLLPEASVVGSKPELLCLQMLEGVDIDCNLQPVYFIKTK